MVTKMNKHNNRSHASGEGSVQVDELELREKHDQGQHDDNLGTTEQGRDGADSQDREAVEESQESVEEPGATDPLLSEPLGAAAPQGGLVTEWNPSQLFEAITRKLGVLATWVRGGAIDVLKRKAEFYANEYVLKDDQWEDRGCTNEYVLTYDQWEDRRCTHDEDIDAWNTIFNTDKEIRDMIMERARQCGGNHDLSIDCILGEKVMIKQLAKFHQSQSVGAMLDIILDEGGSEKKDDEWAELFKQLGFVLLDVFGNSKRLEKITTSQCCNPSKLVKVFIQVMKEASETTSKHLILNRSFLGSIIDGSIADIISLMKTKASWLLRYLKPILNDLDAICSKWTDDQEEDVEQSEKKKKIKKKDSLKTDLNITCLRGGNNVIMRKLVEFKLTASVKVLVDVLLSAKEDDQEEDAEWVNLFKELGPDMLHNVFGLDSGPLFMKIIKRKRWCKNASVAETIFDGMPVTSADSLLIAPVDQNSIKTVFTELATSCNSLCSHDLFQRYTNARWKQLGPYCILSFVLYLCMTFSLIYTLVTSVMAVNVHIYESRLDHSRLVCEVIAAISVIGCLLIELYQINRSRWDYFTDWNNWLELLSSLLLCISIPLRFKAEHVHWYLFAFGYLLWIPQWRKQSVVYKKFYIQAEIFVQVLKHDVPWFSLLFLVINIAFAGASYLTLRGENNLHVDNQTSSFPQIFFMGVRTLAEGQPVLEYYGNEEYRAMSIVVMVVFLFAMCVILLNLLIAQISKTLEKKSETMDNYYHIRLAFTLAWMDILLPECCKKLGKTEERWKNYMAQGRSYKEKIISKTEKMDQHLAKITGDLQDVSQKFSIRVKKTAKQDRADTKARNGIATDVQKARQQEGKKQELRKQWNTQLKDKDTEQRKVLDLIEKCIQEGHTPAEWMVDNQCPLLVAVGEDDRIHVLRRLLGLLDPKSTEANERKAEALYAALRHTDRFRQAALLVNNLKTSDPQRVLDCFHHGANLNHDDYYNNPLFQVFWLLFLDDMMNRKDMSLFDKNVQGEEAEGTEPTIFHRLAYGGNTDVFKPAALQLYVEKKWKECGRKKQFICDMLVYLITLVCLTVVVVLTGQADDVNSYQTETDRARLVFEIISAALLLYTLVKEAIELVSTYRIEFVEQKKKIKESRWWLFRKLEYFADLKMMCPVAHVWRGIRAYWKDHFNKAECTSTLLLLPVTITARLIDTNAFWYIFAFGYFLWVMIVFKYASIHKELSTYAQSLWIIITTDVVYFLVLFAVVNLAFSGFFVLILKGENIIHVHNETSTFWGTLFFGVRALTDGQNSLNYYDADGGPDGYNTFLTVATMVVFLFVVIVILANILIAQLSRSYNDVQEDARAAALVRKARDIARLERFEWPYCFGPLKSKTLERIDKKEFTKYDNIESTATIKIKNVDRLTNKLAKVESDVDEIKVKAMRCKNEWSTERHDLNTAIKKLKEENEKMKIQLNALTEENISEIVYHF